MSSRFFIGANMGEEFKQFLNTNIWDIIADAPNHAMQSVAGLGRSTIIPAQYTEALHDEFQPKEKNPYSFAVSDIIGNVPLTALTTAMLEAGLARANKLPVGYDALGNLVTLPTVAKTVLSAAPTYFTTKGIKQNNGEDWTTDDTIKTLATLAGRGGIELYAGGEPARLLRSIIPDLRKTKGVFNNGGVDFDVAKEQQDKQYAQNDR